MSNSIKIEGIKELEKKLRELQGDAAIKTIRKSMVYATRPTRTEMKAAAPVSTAAHRTYKKRLVTPGFLSRSIRAKTYIEDGVIVQKIGVEDEAFYGVQFHDEIATGQARPKRWFKNTFIKNTQNIIDRMVFFMKKEIDKLSL